MGVHNLHLNLTEECCSVIWANIRLHDQITSFLRDCKKNLEVIKA